MAINKTAGVSLATGSGNFNQNTQKGLRLKPKAIPKPSSGGRPATSPHRESLSKLKSGKYISCTDNKEQSAVYAVGKRMNKNVCKRTVDGEKRVYLLPIKKQVSK